MKSTTSRNISYVQRGIQYEQNVCQWLHQHVNWLLTTTKHTSDRGINLYGTTYNSTVTLYDQCKYKANKVSTAQVRELIGSVEITNNSTCLLYISTQPYTIESINLLQRYNTAMILLSLVYNTNQQLVLQRCTMNEQAKLLFPGIRMLSDNSSRSITLISNG